MAKSTAPKKSLRPRSREQGMGLGLRPQTREQVAESERLRKVSEDFGDVEFGADLAKDYLDPLARLGFDPKVAKTVPARWNAAGLYALGSEDVIDNLNKDRPEDFYKEDIKQGDVLTLGDFIGSKTVWTHEFRHRGLNRLMEDFRDADEFINKYIPDADAETITVAKAILQGPSEEVLTDYMDRRSPPEPGFRTELLSDDTKSLKEKYKKPLEKVESAIITAARDKLTEEGVPLPAERKQEEKPGWLGGLLKRLGFNEGGSVSADNEITQRSTGEADFYIYGGRNYGSLAEAQNARAAAMQSRSSSPRPAPEATATPAPTPTPAPRQPRSIGGGGEITYRGTGEADFYSYGGRNFSSLGEAQAAKARDLLKTKRETDGSVGSFTGSTKGSPTPSVAPAFSTTKSVDEQMADVTSSKSDVKGVNTPSVTTTTLGRSENIGKPATAADQAAIAVTRGYNNAPLVGEPLSADDVATIAQFSDQVSQEKGMGLSPFGGTGNLNLSAIAEAINSAARAEQANLDEGIVGIDAPQTGGLFGGRDVTPADAQSVANQAAISRGSFTGMDEAIAGLDSYGGEPAGPTGGGNASASAPSGPSPSAEYSGGMDTADSGTVGDIGALFNKGGLAMEEQMKLFEEGGLSDDGMDRDPVSGNEIPPGSNAVNVRDDIPAQLSDGEYIVPADVVKYFGVRFFEDLRDQAKQGLQQMDEDGRIGGEPMMPNDMGPSQASGLSEEDMAALAQMTGMAQGGMAAPQIDEDQLIDRVIQAAKTNPQLSQKLQSKGVMMAQGGMVSNQMADPYQQQQTMYSTGMAEGGLTTSFESERTFDPTQYSTIGSSYFDANTGPVTIVEYVGPNGEILPIRTQNGRPIDSVPAGFKTKQQKEAESLSNTAVMAPTVATAPTRTEDDYGGLADGEGFQGIDLGAMSYGDLEAAIDGIQNNSTLSGMMTNALSNSGIGKMISALTGKTIAQKALDDYRTELVSRNEFLDSPQQSRARDLEKSMGLDRGDAISMGQGLAGDGGGADTFGEDFGRAAAHAEANPTGMTTGKGLTPDDVQGNLPGDVLGGKDQSKGGNTSGGNTSGGNSSGGNSSGANEGMAGVRNRGGLVGRPPRKNK